MTNEEKAREIARECVYCFADAENGALKMAQWKDEQFNGCLNEEYEFAQKDCHSDYDRGWRDAVEFIIHKFLKK